VKQELPGNEEPGEGRNGQPAEPTPNGNVISEYVQRDIVRRRRNPRDNRVVVSVQVLEEEANGMGEDADLADDIFAFIRRMPQPWTLPRLCRVAATRKFKEVDRMVLQATIAATLLLMRKTAQQSVRRGAPKHPNRATAIYLNSNVVDMYCNY